MAETGSAVFRAVADWAQLRREARRAAKDLKDTRSAARDLDDSLGDLDKSGDGAATRLRGVGESARSADKDVKGLLGSIRSWSQTRTRAVLGVDAERAKEEIRRLKDDLAGLRVTRLGIDADTARAREQLNEVQGELDRLRSQPTSARVDADITAAVARVDELKARISSLRGARLQVDADTARARAQLAAVSRDADQLGRKRPTVTVDVDTAKIRPLVAALGAVTATAALIGPVVGAVTALAGGLLSVVSAAAPAAGGLLGVAAAAGAAGQAAVVAKISTLGVADALKALQAKQKDTRDEFDKANPAVQRFAKFLDIQVLPALNRVRDEIQARALPKFEEAIRTALPLLGLFGGKLGDTADIIGDLSIRAAQMMTSGPWTRDFGTILDSNNRIIETLGSGTLVTADALRILWVTAGPLAERLALLVLHGLEIARAFLEAKRGSGELADFMTRSGDVITQLTGIVGDFLVSLFNIGKAAAPAGQILLDSLESVAQKFRELTGSVEGQTRMRQFFLDMVPTVQELGRLFVDLLGVFGRVASNPDTADFIKQIRTELLPALDRLMTSLGDGVVPQLISLASHAADVISELGGGALLGFVTTLNGIASALSWILSIPGLGDFVGLILTLAGTGYALKLVGGAITGIAEALKYLSPVLDIVITGVRALAVALAANPLVLIITGIALAALLIITHWDTVKRWLAEFWQWIKDAAQAVWDFLVALFGNNAVTDTISGAWDSVKNTTAAAWDWCKQTIGAAWDWMTQKTSAAAGIVGGTISGAWDSIKNNTGQAWDSVKNTVSGAWDWITGASDRGSGSLRGVLQGVVDTLGSTFAGAWDAAWNKVAAVWDGISNTVRGAVDYISNLIDWISNKISNAWNAVTNFASSAASAIIPGYAEGGMVGGTGSGDNQIIRATAGEWVVPKDVTARFLPFLKAITFGSVRSLTQIIQPKQAKLIQDRLAGVPDLTQLSGLRELITGVQGSTSTTLDTTDNSRSVNVVTNVYNPIAEPASDSVTDRMRTLSLMGVFS